MEPADVVLLERWVGRRDADAFQAIVARHSAMVFSACRRVLGDPVRAEDVTQECFLKLAMGDARPGPFLGPWLHRMATRRCLDTLRAEHRRRARETRYVAEGPQSVEVRWETLEPLIDEALANLPERFRVPIVAHYLEGLTHEQVAQRLGVPRQTVSYRISKGLERLGVYLRSRGVNVAYGALIAGLKEMPVEAPPAELTAKLSKMALARAARALPHAHWLSGSTVALGAGAVVLILAAAATWVGVTRTVPAQEKTALPVAVAQTEAPEGKSANQTRQTNAAMADTVVASAVSTGVPGADVMPAGGLAASVEPPGKEDEPEPCAVAGSVVDEAREPIADAKVQVLFAPHPDFLTADNIVFAAKTDAKGLFRIADIPPHSRFQLSAQAEGFDGSSVKSLILEAGKNLDDVSFILKKGVTLSGKILGCDGLPVPNALVLRRHYETSLTSGGGGGVSSQTDEKGQFKLGFPAEGTALLRVATPTWGDAFFEVDVQSESAVELRMPLSARLTGRVTRADGTPATDVKVAVCPMVPNLGTAALYQCSTDQDGRYEFASLPPDLEYRAVVQNESSFALSSRQMIGVLAAGSSKEWNFSLEAPARVRGTVTGEQTGRPQKGVHIGWICDKESNNRAATTGDDGTYELELFAPGTYHVYPMPASGEWDDDFAQACGRNVTLELGSEQTVDFKFPDAFSLGVRVVDGQGKPVPDAEVQAAFSQQPNATSIFSFGHTDASGRYRFEGFRPGFEAWLIAKLPSLGARADDDAQAAETNHITGEPGVDYPEETVVLYGESQLRGVALGPDGGPLSNCRIAVLMRCPGIVVDGAAVGGRSTTVYVDSDAAGAFKVPDEVFATSFDLTITAQSPSGSSCSAYVGVVECVAGQVLDLGTLRLQLDPDTGATEERITVPVTERE